MAEMGASCGASRWSRICEAARTLRPLGDHSEVGVGDGSRGWTEHAPFDAVMVTRRRRAAPDAWRAIEARGRMVFPLGGANPAGPSYRKAGGEDTFANHAVRFTSSSRRIGAPRPMNITCGQGREWGQRRTSAFHQSRKGPGAIPADYFGD